MIYERVKCIYEKLEKSDVKPFIVVCGELNKINTIYVVMDKDKAYKFDSLLTAVDVIIKCCIIMKEAESKFYKHIIQFF